MKEALWIALFEEETEGIGKGNSIYNLPLCPWRDPYFVITAVIGDH
jgi:hypothetical protein